MSRDELLRLDEHPGGTAARVVDAALERLEHLDEEPDDAARGVELAALLALGARELGKEILIAQAEDVFRAALVVAELDVGDEVDELAEALFVEGGAGLAPGADSFEGGVVELYTGHGIVDELADRGLLGHGFKMRPARFGRDPEDVPGAVFVGVFGVGALGAVGLEPGVIFDESIGYILEEDEAEDDVLVFGGVHGAAEGVGRGPELGFEAKRGAGVLTFGFCGALSWRHFNLL